MYVALFASARVTCPSIGKYLPLGTQLIYRVYKRKHYVMIECKLCFVLLCLAGNIMGIFIDLLKQSCLTHMQLIDFMLNDIEFDLIEKELWHSVITSM